MSPVEGGYSLGHALDELLDYNYDDNLVHLNKAEVDLAPRFPLSFYDRHIASSLMLRSIKHLPGILEWLSDTCDDAVPQILAIDMPNFQNQYRHPRRVAPTPFDRAHSVYSHYHERIGNTAIRYVSKLYIHPKDPAWESCLGFEKDELGVYNRNFGFIYLDGICFSAGDRTKLSLSEDVFNSIDDVTRRKLVDLSKRFPAFAIWHFFAMVPTAVNLLKKMQPTSFFKSVAPKTTGLAPLPPLYPPEDSSSGIVDLVSKIESNQYYLRPQPEKSAHANVSRIVIPRPERHAKIYVAKPEHFIQRAWNRAVVKDASFLVFHCGSYQRIGYRSRKSQTLYLSELIDTRRCTPYFGEIQMGLHMACFQDAADRSAKRDAEESCDERLRRSERLRAEKSKQDGDDAEIHDESKIREAVQKSMAGCDVALVRLNYDQYRSPAPSAFVRLRPSCAPGLFDRNFKQPKRRKVYSPKECFSATVTAPPLGHGAVGVVHRITVDVESESGKLASDFLIKFAFTPKQQAKLRNEYAIYEHLAGAEGVEGVVAVHGLFEDVETSILAVIMTDGGISLRKREIQRGNTNSDDVVVTEAETTGLKRVLQSIHRAGVRHRDIRPENLLINTDGQVNIIDFDRAEVTDRKNALARELDGLRRLLINKYYENCYSGSESGS